MSSKFDRFGFLQYDAEKNTGMYPPDPGDTIFDDAFRHCPGWTNLLLSFCEKVTALFEFYHMDVNKSLVILQAKEKFGGIRIYCEDTPNRQLNRKLDTLCTNLLEASEKVCSQCGAPPCRAERIFQATRINQTGIGPQLGGTTSALAVNIEWGPTHIAGLPVAVTICCHACRHSKRVL